MSLKTRTFLYIFISVTMLLCFSQAAFADLEAVRLATVSISSTCGTGEEAMVSSGSGFIVSADGYIVTNAHVIISNDIAIEVKLGDRTHTVTGVLLYIDDKLDIAVLKVALGGLNFLTMGDDTQLKLGQRVFAVGSPLVFKDIFTDGIYSSYNEELQMIQHTAELSHGNSGGPLVTEEGLVMGVNTIVVAFPGESRYYFAIPITIVHAVLDGIMGQTNPPEVLVNCADRLTEPGTEPSEPSVPEVPGDQPAPYVPDNTGVVVDSAYAQQTVDTYPTGWMTYSSSYFHYSFDLPGFYSYMFTEDDEFATSNLEFFGSYDNFDDSYFAAVPMVELYIGFPDSESLYDFKTRIADGFIADGFVKDEDFAMQDVYTGSPDLEFDVWWFDGEVGTDYDTLSRATYFIRDPKIDTAYYCLDFTFNNTFGDDVENITLPLLIQILWTFNTGA